jgi:hypothetical protein
MKRVTITAGELLAKLEADPEFQKKNQEREARVAVIRERCAKDEAALVEEIRDAGYEIESVYDFVNAREEYPDALSILIRHLEVPHDPKIREGVIRALTVKYGGALVEEALLKHFFVEADSHLRWVFANALKTAMPLARRKKHPEIAEVFRRKKTPNRVAGSD